MDGQLGLPGDLRTHTVSVQKKAENEQNAMTGDAKKNANNIKNE